MRILIIIVMSFLASCDENKSRREYESSKREFQQKLRKIKHELDSITEYNKAIQDALGSDSFKIQ